jgi:hypothetical protein
MLVLVCEMCLAATNAAHLRCELCAAVQADDVSGDGGHHLNSQVDGRCSAGEMSCAERAEASATTSVAEPTGLAKSAKELRRAKYAAQSTSSGVPHARPLRVLCLHGFRSSAKKLRGRLMGFTRKLKVRCPGETVVAP